jgi:hypothetical protein
VAKTAAERQRDYRERKRQALIVLPAAGASASSAVLGDAGQRLWDDVAGAWELSEHERAILTQACRGVDRLDAMAAELAAAPQVVKNSRGDLTAHPLLVESRQTSALVARLFAALGLPSGDEDEAPQRRSRRAPYRGFYCTTAS